MISGKGFFIWNLADKEILLPEFLASVAKEHNFSHLLLKVADGSRSYNVAGAPAVVSACHKLGIEVWGWQYVYGNSPVYETLAAIRRMDELDLDGFVIDAESEYKQAGAAAAKVYMSQLREKAEITIALSSYRWPSYHPEFPWDEFMTHVDFAMPQVYWMGAHNPTAQLARCVSEYRDRWPEIPIVPTGAAFQEGGWKASEEEIIAFAQAVKDQGLSAYNYWEWANAVRYGLWETVAGLDVELVNPEPVVPTIATVKTNVINLRSEPSAKTNANKIGALLRGTQGKIIEENMIGKEHWVKVQVEGWIAAEYYGSKLAELK